MNLYIEDNSEIEMKVNQTDEIELRAGDTINLGSSDYNDLANKPSIEGVELIGNKTAEDLGLAEDQHTHTKSEITDFAHTHAKADIPDFAHTHSYDDLTNKPTIPTITVNGNSYPITSITKTTLSSVSGVLVAYDDGNNGELFFADGVGLNTVKTAIEGTIPHDTSELTNGAGFITLSDLPIYDGGVQ